MTVEVCPVCRLRQIISIPDHLCATCLLGLPGYAEQMAQERVESLRFWEVVHA